MLFPTATFATFFTTVFVAHSLFRARPRPWMLSMLGASVVFYGWTDPRLVLLLAFAAVVSHATVRFVTPRPRSPAARFALVAAVTVLLGVLALFKYAAFFAQVADQVATLFGSPLGLRAPELLLPIGISFITFQAIGYCIDAYRGDLPETPSALESALFVSFFPQLVAGPILRAVPFMAQLRTWPRRSGSLPLAGMLILGGLVKKVVVADALFEVNTAVTASPESFSAFDNALSIYGGMVRVFCDVSSYTDIALGLGILLGVQLPENFNRPFAARSVSDFWRRWHLSMSNWFRDYLFEPLSGRTPSGWRLVVAAMVTMVLSGLWHGAGWGFVVWGALNGVALVVEGAWRVRRLEARRRAVRQGTASPARSRPAWLGRVAHLVGVIATFHFVVAIGGLFLGDSVTETFHKFSQLAGGWTSSELLTPLLAAAMIGVVAAQFVPWRLSSFVVPRLERLPAVVQAALFAVAVTVVFAFAVPGTAPYLYFGI